MKVPLQVVMLRGEARQKRKARSPVEQVTAVAEVAHRQRHLNKQLFQ